MLIFYSKTVHDFYKRLHLGWIESDWVPDCGTPVRVVAKSI